MPLTTDGLIEEMQRFRSDKLALVALVGSMGAKSEADALDRLREIKALMAERLTEMRKKGRVVSREERVQQPIMQDVYLLASEIEPWLARVCFRENNP